MSVRTRSLLGVAALSACLTTAVHADSPATAPAMPPTAAQQVRNLQNLLGVYVRLDQDRAIRIGQLQAQLQKLQLQRDQLQNQLDAIRRLQNGSFRAVPIPPAGSTVTPPNGAIPRNFNGGIYYVVPVGAGLNNQ